MYDEYGVKLVSYIYDAWGRQTVTYHNGGQNIFAINSNPFRYRGYYYDIDLDMYYLNSRYYDQNTGRFISPDDALYHSMLGYNMYAYCNNNPVSFYDPTGESAAAVLVKWTIEAGSIAAAEPTPIGEVVLVLGFVVIGLIYLTKKGQDVIDTVNAREHLNSPKKSITQDESVSSDRVTEAEIKTKEEVDPFRRPEQKKQGGELKSKARRGDGFKDRSNKRNGRKKPPKHSPSKKGHRKYFGLSEPLKIF